MRLIILLFVVCNVMYADVYFPNFKDMLVGKTPYNSTLYKNKETEYKIYYKGQITLSGVLEWQMTQDEEDFYWQLVFFPDVSSALPRLSLDDEQAIFLNSTLKKDPALQKNSFLQLYNILANKLTQEDEYILGKVAIRATLTLKDYYINKHLDSEADTRYYASADSIKILSDIRKWYMNKSYLPSLGLLSYTSKDAYINLRQTPNGKILTQIQKSDMPKPCEFKENKGVIFYFEQDSANSGWLKVAYIPPQAKDTSKAIYGVIHESQVEVCN